MKTLTPKVSEPQSGVAAVDPEDSIFAKLDSIAVGRGPIADIAAGTGAGTLVVTNYGDNSVSVIDADNPGAGRTTVSVDGEPFAAAVADNLVFVNTAAAAFDSVSVIDTVARSVTAGYAVGLDVSAGAIAVEGKRVLVGSTGRDGVQLSVIDTATDEVSAIDIATGSGHSVDAVRVSPDGQRVYVGTSYGYRGRLVVVDADTAGVIGAVTIGAPIRDVALSPDGRSAYVLTCDPRQGGAVDIVDMTNDAVAATVRIDGWPTQMAVSPDGARVFVVGQDHVAVLCTVTNEIVDTLSVDASPSCVAVSPDGARLYVADYAGVVTVFSLVPTTTLPPFQVMAKDVVDVPDVRELEPAV